MKTKPVILEIITAMLMLLWVYAALSKWLDPRFIYQLTSSPLIGYHARHILYYLLPAGELLIAIALLQPQAKKIGLITSAVLLATFTAYIIYILTFAPAIPCSCGGIINKLSWKGHLMFNFSFLILNVIAIVCKGKK